MENRTRKKRTQSSAQRKERKDTNRSKTGNRPGDSGNKKSTPPAGVVVHIPHSPLNIPLNPDTARQAVILSEIIGKPVSKRGKRW